MERETSTHSSILNIVDSQSSLLSFAPIFTSSNIVYELFYLKCVLLM